MEKCLNLLDLLRLSVKGLKSRTLRSILTLLGILIGVVLLTIVLTVSDSTTYSLTSIFTKGGLNNVYLVSRGTISFSWTDISQMERIPHVMAVSPYLTIRAMVNYGGYRTSVTIIGLPKEKISFVIPDLEVKEGSKILMEGCFVGASLVEEAEERGLKVRIGDPIYINFQGARTALRVEGILEQYGFTFIGPIDNSLIVPHYIVQKLVEEVIGSKMGGFQTVIISVDNVDNVDFVIEHLKYLYSGQVNIFAVKDIVKAVTEGLRSFTILIGSIASVTLVVASVGVMNAMFTTVMERIRIIGVLRALGARRYEILLNIVLEALTLAVIAIVVGIPLGVFISSLLIQGGIIGGLRGPGRAGGLGSIEFVVNNQTLMLVAFVTLALTLVGTLPPAYRAAKLEPAQALRYE
ncbi:MAG: hypothetical protein DRO23_00255 [Thermoprotei archaeon]|nr:MAG: hypothetical protein DRO23_00255 [Thermoprotei archaeon]